MYFYRCPFGSEQTLWLAKYSIHTLDNQKKSLKGFHMLSSCLLKSKTSDNPPPQKKGSYIFQVQFYSKLQGREQSTKTNVLQPFFVGGGGGEQCNLIMPDYLQVNITFVDLCIFTVYILTRVSKLYVTHTRPIPGCGYDTVLVIPSIQGVER